MEGKRFYHISTDDMEVWVEGCLETTAYDPNSPYSASASSDHLLCVPMAKPMVCRMLTNCSNYGPFHFPEKLIPLFINNIIQNKPLPVYMMGNIRVIGYL
jgi:dTDP-glucose 4,6-dehydratase